MNKARHLLKKSKKNRSISTSKNLRSIGLLFRMWMKASTPVKKVPR
jgi:hypothetical protein